MLSPGGRTAFRKEHGQYSLQRESKRESASHSSCPTLCDPMDCSRPGSPVHGVLQARIQEWVAIPFSRGIFPTQGLNLGLLHCRQILYPLCHQGSPYHRREGPICGSQCQQLADAVVDIWTFASDCFCFLCE